MDQFIVGFGLFIDFVDGKKNKEYHQIYSLSWGFAILFYFIIFGYFSNKIYKYE